jgi:hypothetical protein
VYIIGHSQGAAVAVLLTQRLLEKDVLNPQKQRIGILSLAGVHHGTYDIFGHLPFRKCTMELKDLSIPNSSNIYDYLSLLYRSYI